MSESKHTIYGSLTALDREDVTRVLWTRTGEWTQASEVEREIEHLRQQRDAQQARGDQMAKEIERLLMQRRSKRVGTEIDG